MDIGIVMKQEIEKGEYLALIDVILNNISSILRKLTRNKWHFPYWVSALVLAILTLSFGLAISLLVGELTTITPSTVGFTIWLAGIGFLWMICARYGYHLLLKSLSKGVIDYLVSPEDLEDLQKKLQPLKNIKLQVLLSLLLGFLALIWPIFWRIMGSDFPGYGQFVVLIIVWSQTGPGVYFFFLFLSISFGVSSYECKIQGISARNSDVIASLSELFNGILLMGAIVLAAFTALLFFLEALGIQLFLVWVLGAWGILLLLFFNNQYILAKIIKRHKQTKLKEIQKEIYLIEVDQSIADKNSLDTINHLLDYYDRIEKMPASAFSIEEIFRLIQAMLLPVITSLLANVKLIIEMFSK